MTVLAAMQLALVLGALGVTLWNALSWRRVRPKQQSGPEDAAPSVSILIPARNEEQNLPVLLESLLPLDSSVLEILVLDDHSTDGTAAVVREQAQRTSGVRLLTGDDLPPGWSGKCWACRQLAGTARGRWLLFIDADARLSCGAVAGILAAVRDYNASLLSCWPGIEMQSGWERVLMPMLNFLTFTLYPAPLAFIRPGDSSLGLAHGACILIDRLDYAALGGHDLVRAELFEDTKLARHWRARGRSSYCLDGQDIVRVRMYQNLAEILRGFEKNFYPAFGASGPFIAFLALRAVLFQLPLLLAPLLTILHLAGRAQPAVLLWLLWISCASVLGMRMLVNCRFRYPWWSLLLHSLGELLLLRIALGSWWHVKSGRGVEWKGRRYSANLRPPEDLPSAATGDDGR